MERSKEIVFVGDMSWIYFFAIFEVKSQGNLCRCHYGVGVDDGMVSE